jgi:hypothetical protein
MAGVSLLESADCIDSPRMSAIGRFAPVITSFSSYLSDRFTPRSSRQTILVPNFRDRPIPVIQLQSGYATIDGKI